MVARIRFRRAQGADACPEPLFQLIGDAASSHSTVRGLLGAQAQPAAVEEGDGSRISPIAGVCTTSTRTNSPIAGAWAPSTQTILLLSGAGALSVNPKRLFSFPELCPRPQKRLFFAPGVFSATGFRRLPACVRPQHRRFRLFSAPEFSPRPPKRLFWLPELSPRPQRGSFGSRSFLRDRISPISGVSESSTQTISDFEKKLDAIHDLDRLYDLGARAEVSRSSTSIERLCRRDLLMWVVPTIE